MSAPESSEWRAGFEAGRYDALLAVAQAACLTAFSPYTTKEERRMARKQIFRLLDAAVCLDADKDLSE